MTPGAISKTRTMVCHYYQIEEEKAFCLQSAIANMFVIRGSPGYFHEHFKSHLIHPVLDIDTDDASFNISDFMEAFQPKFACSFECISPFAVVLSSNLPNATKSSYHVHWPGAKVDMKCWLEFLSWIDVPFKFAIDMEIFKHKSLRMYLCDKPEKDQLVPCHRPMRFSAVYDERGRAQQAFSRYMTSNINNTEAHYKIFFATTICCHGPDNSTSVPIGEFASHTTFKRAQSINSQRLASMRHLPGLDMGVNDGNFDGKKALIIFNSSTDTETGLKLLIEYMNKYFAVICWQSALTYVKKCVDDNGYTYLDEKSRSDFLNAFDNLNIVSEKEVRGKKKLVTESIGKVWNNNAARNNYDKKTFNPHPLGSAKACTQSELNLFYEEGIASRDLCAQYQHYDHNIIQEHLLNVIANGNEQHCKYINKWLAKILQKPWEKCHTAIILKGPEGNGKSTPIGRIAKHLFGPFFEALSSADDVVGRFNKIACNRLFIILEEAVWVGNDKKKEGALKTLITEDWWQMEAKNVNRLTMANYMNFLFVTNESYVVPAGGNSRRFVCFETSSARLDDRDYMKRVLEGFTKEAILSYGHYLYSLDLTEFDRGQEFPITELLLTQQELNMSLLAHWWKKCLQLGYHVPVNMCNDSIERGDETWVRMINTKVILDYFNNTLPPSQRMVSTKFAAEFKELTQAGLKRPYTESLQPCPTTGRMTKVTQRLEYYSLGTLEQCREYMQNKYRFLTFDNEDADAGKEPEKVNKKRSFEQMAAVFSPSEISELLPLSKLRRIRDAIDKKLVEYDTRK